MKSESSLNVLEPWLWGDMDWEPPELTYLVWGDDAHSDLLDHHPQSQVGGGPPKVEVSLTGSDGSRVGHWQSTLILKID